MAKTYNTLSSVTVGSVLTASDYNEAVENSNNFRNPPMVKCTRSGNLSYTTNTPIVWNNEEYDTDGMHDSVTSTGTPPINSRITPTTAGIYLVVFSLAFTFSGTSSAFQLSIMKNASTDQANNFSNTARTTLHRDSLSAIVTFNGTTDFVWSKFQMDGGTSLSVTEDAQSYLAATWLGQTP